MRRLLKNTLLTFLFMILSLISFTQVISTVKPQAAHPAWTKQTNIYEVNTRQFSASGTFKEFQKSLPRLKAMGVEVLWFIPITPIGLAGRKGNENELGSYYAVRDYKAVNPEFGTMTDFKNLVKYAHSLGFKVITDWVPNHSSPDNGWITRHPDFYVHDSLGNIIAPYDWTDTRKLNYNNKELRDTMIAAMKYWLTETNIDGFRCDDAADVPDDFWKRCIAELKKVRNVFMLAEAEKPSLHEVGFDATYGWYVMNAMTALYAGKVTVPQFDSAINKQISLYPKNAYKLYFTTNHDENSWNGTEFEKYGDAYKAFAVFTQTMYQSIPLIYNGQEMPNKKRLKFFVRDPIEWTGKYEMAPFYRSLLMLRKKNPGLAADGDYKKIATANDNAVFAFMRWKQGHKVVVVLNLSNQPQHFTIKDKNIFGICKEIFTGKIQTLAYTHDYVMNPWGYMVYDYDVK